jgi:hypothetical protein
VTADRFRQQGEETVKDAELSAVHLLRNLPAGEAENFAVALQSSKPRLLGIKSLSA